MSCAMLAAVAPCFATVEPSSKQRRQRKNSVKTTQSQKKTSGAGGVVRKAGFGAEKKEPLWQCVKNCGACCKLDKGPAFPSPEEIFDDPSDIQLYESLVGPDGWCIHFEKSTRTCSIYADRPYFCRVEPEIFEKLYGISEKVFSKEACSSCVDTIKAVHGPQSEELDKFRHAIWS